MAIALCYSYNEVYWYSNFDTGILKYKNILTIFHFFHKHLFQMATGGLTALFSPSEHQ